MELSSLSWRRVEKKKNEQKLGNIWDTIKNTNIHIIGDPERKEKGQKEYLKKEEQKASQIYSEHEATNLRNSTDFRCDKHRAWPRHITNDKDKKRVGKAVKQTTSRVQGPQED